MGASRWRRMRGGRRAAAACTALLERLSLAVVDEGGLGEAETERGSSWGVTCLIAVAVMVGLAVCAGLGALLVGGFFGARVVTSSSSGPAPIRMYMNEYGLPHAQSQPHGITAGPDGAVWFTESGGQRIGRISAAGMISEFPLPSGAGHPLDIAAGPDGNLWFTEDVARIGRMTPEGDVTEYPLSTSGVQIGGVAAGPDGNLWFTESGPTEAIGRITPQGAITEYPLPHPNSQPAAISPGHDGNLWFTEVGGNRIGRITPQGTVAEFAIPTAGSDPEGITAGPNAAVWFTENAANKYARITADGHITEYQANGTLQQPRDLTSIAADRTGKLWFTTKDNHLISLTPSGNFTSVIFVTTPNPELAGLVEGADGSLWFTEMGGNNIGRVQFTGA